MSLSGLSKKWTVRRSVLSYVKIALVSLLSCLVREQPHLCVASAHLCECVPHAQSTTLGAICEKHMKNMKKRITNNVHCVRLFKYRHSFQCCA